MKRSIIDRLKDFGEKLKSGTPIKATTVTVEHTPDGTLTTRQEHILRSYADVKPPRFRWTSAGYVRWKFGVVLLNQTASLWEIHTFGLHEIKYWDPLLRDAHTGPTPTIAELIGPAGSFQWLDNDFCWPVVQTQAR